MTVFMVLSSWHYHCENSPGSFAQNRHGPLHSIRPSYRLVQGGPKSDTPLVFEFPLLLNALYLQFLFTCVSFLLNNVVLRLLM